MAKMSIFLNTQQSTQQIIMQMMARAMYTQYSPSDMVAGTQAFEFPSGSLYSTFTAYCPYGAWEEFYARETVGEAPVSVFEDL